VERITTLSSPLNIIFIFYGEEHEKNITITNVDGLNMADKISVDTPHQKKKMIHEQVFEHFGIDPDKAFENAEILKMIPIDWIPDIITFNINACNIPRMYQNINKSERAITLSFETSEICEKFVKEFNLNMLKSVNKFISSKGEDPKKYNRIVVIESTVNEQQLIFRY